MKILLNALLVLLLTTLLSCIGVYLCTEGSGRLIKQTLDLPKFKNLSLNVPAKILIIQDSSSKVEIEIDDNLLNAIYVGVENETLNISSERGLCPRKLEISVISPFLNSIEVNGSSDIIAQTPIHTNDFAIKINGSGDIQIDSIKAQSVNIKINGSGDIRLGGVTDTFVAIINGSGDLFALNLAAKNVDVKANGAGDVYVNSLEKLNVNINGSGDLYYIGEPSVSDIKILGSGIAKKIKNNEDLK